MHPEVGPVDEVVGRLTERFGDAPSTVIVLGSGLGAVVDRVENAQEASFVDIGLPDSSVKGHSGRVVRGAIRGHEVLVQAGRVHLYEGLGAQRIVRGVRAYAQWGVKNILLTASVGGMAPHLRPGDLVIIEDHINLQHANPLTGPTWGGVRFPDLTRAYDPELREALVSAGRRAGVRVSTGVYVAVTGPAYETPAEVRMFANLGDVVGMSTVPEVLAAAQVGLRAAAIGVVANMAAGIADGALSHDEVTSAAGEASEDVASLIEVALGRF